MPDEAPDHPLPADDPARPMEWGIPLHDMLQFRPLPAVEGSPFTEVLMPVEANALGFTGALHGGAIATLVDLACAMAAVRATGFDVTKESMVTSDMHLRYVGRPRTSNVIARAEVVRVGGQLIVVDCRVVDENDHLLATADAAMMRVPLRKATDA